MRISTDITPLLENAFFFSFNLYILYSLNWTLKMLLASDMVRSLRNVICRKFNTFKTEREIFMCVVQSYDQHPPPQ